MSTSIITEIRAKMDQLVMAADEGSVVSRQLMTREDVSPELSLLLTELRGFFVSYRAAVYDLNGLIGAGAMTEQLPVTTSKEPQILELPLITTELRRVPTGHPPRHVPGLPGKDLAAGEHDDR